MVEPIAEMPEGTFGFRAWKRVDAEEYKRVIIPALEAAVKEGNVRLLFEVDPEFERFDPATLWADMKEGVNLGLHDRDAFERFALVTDLDWMRRGTELFAWAMPGESRVFSSSDLEAAKAWLAA